MQKSIILLALAILVSFGFQSCRKTAPPVVEPTTTNINAQLKENQTYQFTLPANTTIVNGKQQSYNITAPASHSSISLITTDASGNMVYQYTPGLNYIGSDFVTISNVPQQMCAGGGCNIGGGCCNGGACCHNGCCHGGGGCCGKASAVQQNIVNINFTITGNTNTNPITPVVTRVLMGK